MRTADHTFARNARRLRAFTMIEVMICVVILAIASAIVVPMIGNRSDLKLAAATRTLIADLQYAQNLAIATRDPVYVRFEANKYTLFTRAGTVSTTLTHPIDRSPFVVQLGSTSPVGTLRSIAMAKPNFGSGVYVVGFDSLGAPLLLDEATSTKTSPATAAAVTLTCDSLSQVLYVEPYTGEISVP